MIRQPILLFASLVALTATTARAANWNVESLQALSPAQLNSLFRQGQATGFPAGKVRGTVLARDGRALGAPASAAARLVWQGKVMHPESGRAVNRFFGLRGVPAALMTGPSWLDGQPSLLLEYRDTSRIYARYRDELRQVGPGVFLGVMFDRTTAPSPTPVLYFALEQVP